MRRVLVMPNSTLTITTAKGAASDAKTADMETAVFSYRFGGFVLYCIGNIVRLSLIHYRLSQKINIDSFSGEITTADLAFILN
jgi:hypothetical protein